MSYIRCFDLTTSSHSFLDFETIVLEGPTLLLKLFGSPFFTYDILETCKVPARSIVESQSGPNVSHRTEGKATSPDNARFHLSRQGKVQ